MKQPWAECGVCGEKMCKITKGDDVWLKCDCCGLSVEMGFVEQFFAPKYYDRVEKVVIASSFSAKIIFSKNRV